MKEPSANRSEERTQERKEAPLTSPAPEAGFPIESYDGREASLFELHPLPMWVYDLESLRFVAVNEAAIRKYGYSRDEFSSMTIKDIRPPEEVDRLTTAVADVRDHPIVNESSLWTHLKKDGTRMLVNIFGSPLLWEGRPSEMIVVHDVTQLINAEKKLRETERQFKTLIENISDLITLLTEDGNILYQSGSSLSLLGYTPAEMVGRNAFQFLHPEDILKAKTIFQGLSRDPAGQATGTIRFKHKNGSWRHLEVSAKNLASDPEIGAIVANSRDITSRRKAEESLRHSEERYRAYVEQSSEGVWTFEIREPIPTDLPADEQVRLFYQHSYLSECNDHMARMYGLADAQQLIGASLADLLPPSAPGSVEYLTAFVESGYKLIDTESTETDKDGRKKYFLNNLVGIVESGKLVRTLGTQRDITAKKTAEEALATSQRQLQMIAEGTNAILMSTDVRGRVTFINEAGLEVLQVPREGYEGIFYLRLVHPDDRKRVHESFLAIIGQKRPSAHTEFRYLTESGKIGWVSFMVHPNFTDGLLTGVSGIAQEITESKQIEAQLKRERDVLESVTKTNPAGILMTDATGAITFANAQAEQILGAKVNTIVGLLCSSGEKGPSGAETNGPFDLILKTKKPIHGFQCSLRRQGGDIVHLSISAAPLLDEEGNLHAAVFSIDDITERKRASDALAQSREWFKAIFEASRDGIVVERDEIVVYANTAFARMYGFTSSEDLVGQHLGLITWEGDVERVLDYGRKRLAGEPAPSVYELKGKTRSGDLIDVEASVSTAMIGGEKYIITTLRDIRDRKATEAALEESEEQYRRFFQDDLSGNFISTPSGEIIACNPVFAKIFGFDSVEEAMSINASSFYKDPGAQDAYLIQLREQGGIRNLECTMTRKDGVAIEVLANITGKFDDQGKLEYVKGYIQDVTQHKRAMEKLEEQAALLNISRDAIIVRNLEDEILLWNKGAEMLYGWTSAEALGKKVIGFIFREGYQKFADGKAAVLRDGTWSGEMEQFSRSQKDLIVESRWTLIRDREGNPKSILVVNTDITERKGMETQMLRAQRLESLGTLAGGIAHDLNNVLGPILMGTDVLKKRTTEPSSRKLLESMENSVRRGAEMVKQVLTFARGLEGERVLVQMKHLLEEITGFVKETFPKSVIIRTSVEKDLWPILGDATQLHQVLLNLAVNARDAMPQGGTLSMEIHKTSLDEYYAKMHPEAKPGNYVEVRVTDTGTGIPPEILERIFDPFFTTKDAGKGTGLGLSTVLGIVRSHGGFVNVYSEMGKGSQFKVYLPAAQGEVQQEVEAEEQNIRGSGETILIIDDEESIREISRLTLESNGYQVFTANDGTEAVAIFMEHRAQINAVITDMSMPYMDGQATIRALGRLDEKVKIIATSGLFTSRADVERMGQSVRGFLLKPFTASKLLQLLKEVLSQP